MSEKTKPKAPKIPLPTEVLAAAPPRLRWGQAAIAWAQAASGAITFWLTGLAITSLLSGERLSAQLTTALVIFAFLSAGFAAFGAWFSSISIARTESRLRQSILKSHYASSSGSEQEHSGQLLAISTDAVAKAGEYRGGFLGPIVGALTTPLVVLLVMALTVSPAIAGWLTLLLLVVPLAVGAFQRIVSPLGAAFGAKQRSLTVMFLESIQALETLVYARAARRRALAIAREGEEYRLTLMKVLAGNQLLIFVVDAAFSLAIIITATALSAGAISAGTLSLGGAISILLMTVLIVGPVDVIGMFFYIGIGGRASQKRIAQLLTNKRSVKSGAAGAASERPKNEPGVADQSKQQPADETAAISFTKVTAGWGDQTILHDLSFEVNPGERVGLVGPSGVGKSTIAALIQGWLLPESGQVRIAGQDTEQTDPETLRRKISVVEQRTFLFGGTIAQNLRLAKPDATADDLWQALSIAGLSDDVKAMPAGLETPVGEHGARISGGQAQRLAIARAYLHGGDILLLDEATSQLGLAAEASILAALDRLSVGRTVLMIAHRPSALAHVDRVIELGRGGRIER